MSEINLDKMEKDKLIQMGKRFRDLRESRNLTQRELSEMTGYSEQTIRKIENCGKNIGIISLDKYAKAFEMLIGDFTNYIWGVVGNEYRSI